MGGVFSRGGKAPQEDEETYRKRVAAELEVFRRKSAVYKKHNESLSKAMSYLTDPETFKRLADKKKRREQNSPQQYRDSPHHHSVEDFTGVDEGEGGEGEELSRGRGGGSGRVGRGEEEGVAQDARPPPRGRKSRSSSPAGKRSASQAPPSYGAEAAAGGYEREEEEVEASAGGGRSAGEEDDDEEGLPGTMFPFSSVIAWLGGKLPLPGSVTPVLPQAPVGEFGAHGGGGGGFLARKIGEGSSGDVFQGVMPQGKGRPPRPIAVKRLVLPPGTPPDVADLVRLTFANEVRVLCAFSHANLVECLGWATDARQEQMLIVYELLEGGSLAQRLRPPPGEDRGSGRPVDEQFAGGGSSSSSSSSSHSDRSGSASGVGGSVHPPLPPLTPLQRLDIAVGMARALAYLHGPRYGIHGGGGHHQSASGAASLSGASTDTAEDQDTGLVWIADVEGSGEVRPPVLHRDVKSGNVGLTYDGVAKVMDCGLSKIRAGKGGVGLHSSHPAAAGLHSHSLGGGGGVGGSGRGVGGGKSGFSAISGGGFVGTPGYSPPEVSMGVYNTASEVYSYGVVILELLMGCRVGVRTVADARRAAIRHGWVSEAGEEGRSVRNGMPPPQPSMGGVGGGDPHQQQPLETLFNTWADPLFFDGVGGEGAGGEGSSHHWEKGSTAGSSVMHGGGGNDHHGVVPPESRWTPALVSGLGRLFMACTEPDDRDRPKGMGYVLAEVSSLARRVRDSTGFEVGQCILCDEEVPGERGAWCKAPAERMPHFVCSGCLQGWAMREGRESVRCPWSAQCGSSPWTIREEAFQAQLTAATAATLATVALASVESLYASGGGGGGGAGGGMGSPRGIGAGGAASPRPGSTPRTAAFNGVWPEVIRGSLGGWRRSHPHALVANISNRQDLKDADFKHLKGVPYVCMSGCRGVSDAALAFLVGGDSLHPDQLAAAEAAGLPLPTTLPPHTLRICGCTQLTSAGLACLAGIHTLDMSGCSQEAIGDAGLLALGPVKVLRMDHCSQTTITDEGFANLAAGGGGGGQFGGGTGCKELSMRGCSQPTLTSRAFRFFRGILHLDMSRCNQLTIGDEAFVHLRGIRTLLMQGCDQPTITDAAFVHLRGIQTLSIHGCDNRTRTVAPDGTILERYTLTDALFANLRGIKHVNLGYCPQFSNAALLHLGGCDTLDLSGCRQESINASAMKALHGIRTIHMKGCRQALINAARKEGLNIKS